MKKIILCIFALYLQYNSFSFGREVRIVPVTKDAMTGQWNGLFGYDALYGWSELRSGVDEDNIPLSIAQALQKQTYGTYTLTEAAVESIRSWVHLDSGGLLYLIPVEYIPSQIIHKKMTELTVGGFNKSKFAWLPIDELLRHRTVVKSARGKTSLFVFDFDTRRTIKRYWDQILLPELNCLPSKKPYKFSEAPHIEKYLVRKYENKQNPKPVQKINLHAAKRAYTAEKNQLKMTTKKQKVAQLKPKLTRIKPNYARRSKLKL